jgi:iron complex transport system substrate-binding protein
MVSLNPDLIVMRANAFRGDWYGNAQLAGIAPILAVEVNRGSWKEDLVAQATILGRSAQLDLFLDAYEARLVEARAEAETYFSGKKVYFITASTAEIPVWTNDFACSVAVELGMDVPLFGNENDNIRVSTEQLEILADADLIIRQVEIPEEGSAMNAIATWSFLPAVQAGHVYDISAQFNNGLAIQARLLLDELVKASLLLKEA